MFYHNGKAMVCKQCRITRDQNARAITRERSALVRKHTIERNWDVAEHEALKGFEERDAKAPLSAEKIILAMMRGEM